MTFSGGEPFDQCKGLLPLAKSIKAEGLSLWSYSGYTYEQLCKDPLAVQLLGYIDVLVDGPFILAQKDDNLPYRGSLNQRLLYLQEGNVIRTD